MIIDIENNLDKLSPYSLLSNDEASAAGTVRVKNINSFTLSHAVQFGRTGEEQAEIVVLNSSAIAGTGLSLSTNTRFPHPIDTPVYDINFDKIIVKRSTVGTAGTAVALTGGTIPITPDGTVTPYNDTTGQSTYAYKTSYYNSITTVESQDSDWFVPAGPVFYSLQSIRERARKKLFSSDYIKDDATVDEWINEWLDEMNNSAVDVNESYSLGSTSVAFGTNGLATVSASDFKEVKRIWIDYDGVTSYKASRVDIGDFVPSTSFNSSEPYYYYYGDNVLGVKPEQSGGTAKIVYYKNQPRLDTDGDELPPVMRPFTKSFVDYCAGEAYNKDGKLQQASMYNSRAEGQKQQFVSQITPRDRVDVQMMDMDSPNYADDRDEFYV